VHRIGPLTALLLSLLLTAGVGTAHAVDEESTARKGEHRSRYHVKELTPTRYVFYGRVSTNEGGSLLVLKQPYDGGPFAVTKKVRLDQKGRFRTVLSGALGDCFRMRINASHGYRTTIADLGCLVL
jgi:hypothetical protein